jgi:hypothetical protein
MPCPYLIVKPLVSMKNVLIYVSPYAGDGLFFNKAGELHAVSLLSICVHHSH